MRSTIFLALAADQSARPATAREIFENYRASRAQTIARLESIPLADWWRCGCHQEFGVLRLYEQVSYFANHELTHMHQITLLAKNTH